MHLRHTLNELASDTHDNPENKQAMATLSAMNKKIVNVMEKAAGICQFLPDL